MPQRKVLVKGSVSARGLAQLGELRIEIEHAIEGGICPEGHRRIHIQERHRERTGAEHQVRSVAFQLFLHRKGKFAHHFFLPVAMEADPRHAVDRLDRSHVGDLVWMDECVGSRRLRIANGSGVTTADVNTLLKDFEGARKMMRTMMGGKRMPGMMSVPSAKVKRT